MLECVDSRHRVPLRVIGRGGTSAIVVPPAPDGGPAYRGTGPTDLVCGRCGAALASGVGPGMFRALAFACRCGALNGSF
jgi:hypothetical protein